MDLLQTVRKEGSRGGVNFSWNDVKDSQHRENYLGHSVMAPVGRWQKNKDLGWYAKADDADLTPEEKLEKEQQLKREELRKVKEAEEDAMAKALGLPVPDRSNANEEPLGMSREKQAEVNKALRQALGDESEDNHLPNRSKPRRERRSSRNRDKDPSQRGNTHDDRATRRRKYSRSRSRDVDREGRHSRRRHVRSRSRSRSRRREYRRRSRSRDRKRDDEESRRPKHSSYRPRSRDRRREHGYDRSRSRSPHEYRRHRRD